MTSVIHKIKILFSHKKVSVAVVTVAIAARIIQLIFFYNIRVDGMYQVMAMQNFVHGHGISLVKVLPGDLSTGIYEPLINWPPGYSVLLSLFYVLSGHDYLIAGLALDILAAGTFIFICRRILKVLETPLYLINIFTLLTGFFIYYFYFIASSDAIAITFFLTAVYFTLLLLKRNRYSAKAIVLITIFLFLAGFIKYLFIPVVFIIPLFIFLKGYGDNNRAFKKTGIISFLLLAVSFAAILMYQKFTSGSAVYISEPTHGFFPGNLLSAWPAYPASFINPDTIGLAFPGSALISLRIFQCIHFVLFGVALIFFLHRIFKYGFKKITVTGSFFYLTFFLSAGITALLMILSLTVAREENFPGHLWTYVEDPRYYGLVSVMLHLGVFAMYQYYRLQQSKSLKYFFIGLLLLLLPESFRGIIFTAKRMMNANREEYSWQIDQSIQQYADSIIKRAKTKQPVDNVAVTGSWYYLYYRVGIYSHVPALTQVDRINNLSSLNAGKPTLLLIILQEKDFPAYQGFLSSKQKELAGYFRGLYFYTAHVNPH